jgi:hypothetical protein
MINLSPPANRCRRIDMSLSSGPSAVRSSGAGSQALSPRRARRHGHGSGLAVQGTFSFAPTRNVFRTSSPSPLERRGRRERAVQGTFRLRSIDTAPDRCSSPRTGDAKRPLVIGSRGTFSSRSFGPFADVVTRATAHEEDRGARSRHRGALCSARGSTTRAKIVVLSRGPSAHAASSRLPIRRPRRRPPRSPSPQLTRPAGAADNQ